VIWICRDETLRSLFWTWKWKRSQNLSSSRMMETDSILKWSTSNTKGGIFSLLFIGWPIKNGTHENVNKIHNPLGNNTIFGAH
jgi:hypothetical protein